MKVLDIHLKTFEEPPRLHLTSMAVLAAVLASGCNTVAPTATPALAGQLQERVQLARISTPPSITFRSGDTFANAFHSMGALDGFTYILEGDANQALPGNSVPILSSKDLVSYFGAYNQTVTLTPILDSKYIRVKISKNDGNAKAKASGKCKVTLAGTVPMGAVVTGIASHAGIDVVYADVGAAAYAGVMFPVGYQGTCADALQYMARKADLAVSFNDTGIEYRMMNTATVDIGIPLRDRKIALDILADGRISAGAAGGASSFGSPTSTTGSSQYGVSGNSGGGSGSKSMQSNFTTNYLGSIKSVLESTRTSFGTWHYIPETGQIFIRDRAEAVAATKANLNRMAQAFYGRFEVTLTLYRMTSSKDQQVSGSVARAMNENLALAFGTATAPLAKSTLGIGYDTTVSGVNGGSKTLIQLLSSFGSIETLDTFSLTLQSGVPQTLKVANNTEYVRNVSTTTNGQIGGLTSSIEQANATDGSFVTIQARQAETGKIAVDFGAFINRLDGFDTTQTQTSVVKSQRAFERSFDTMAVVDDGIPYVASIVSQKSSNDSTSTLPGFEGLTGPMSFLIPAVAGSKVNGSAQTYIVVMIEARKQ